MSNFQERVKAWATHTFGIAILANKRERGFRFCEEALELVQAIGITKEEVLKLVDYVFSRPKGTVKEEVGGVGTTLASLCITHGLDMDETFEYELDYKCWPNAEKIRAKHARKVNKDEGSPLPGSDA